MFSLQPPRHIPTLPDSVRICALRCIDALHDSGYEVDGSETLVVELAVHDEEPGTARATIVEEGT